MNPEFSQAICSQWKSERNFNLSSRTNVCARWVFPSPFNLNICTLNCSKETEEIFWGKAALNLLVSRWSVPFEFSFCEGKTRFTHAIAANKRANSHNFKIKKLSLITITFLAVYLMNSVTAACAWHCVTWQKFTLRWPGTERSRMTTLVERFRMFSLS